MDIFISYRRSTGMEIARNIRFSLKEKGYTTATLEYINER